MQRYAVIGEILSKEKPKSVLEVGTWNGRRAVEMMFASGAERYFGFDLFESGTEEDDKREFNVKRRVSMMEVSKFLRRFPFDHELYRGNSKETLKQFLTEHGENSVDFAFIDGGHSVETIESDWHNVRQAVKPGGVVIFDDYYTDRDSTAVGCNRIVKDLDHEILPPADPVVGGGMVNLVLVRNKK